MAPRPGTASERGLRTGDGPAYFLPSIHAVVPREGIMEFLKVNFAGTSRLVLVNGNPGGHTNTVISFPLPGTYRISLEPPNDFVPPVVEIPLAHTSPFQPVEVTFHRLPASAILA
jgi:hypothetical protein